MRTNDDLDCQCGALTGRRCDWHGDASETVLVDYVPEHLHGTAEAAGSHVGLTERIRVSPQCADWITHIPTKDGDVSDALNPWAYLVGEEYDARRDAEDAAAKRDDEITAQMPGFVQLEPGVIVPANILAGEVENGEPAGLSPHYRIRGVGLRPMRDVYPADALTDACRPADTCWAAEVTSYDPAPQFGCSCIRCARPQVAS